MGGEGLNGKVGREGKGSGDALLAERDTEMPGPSTWEKDSGGGGGEEISSHFAVFMLQPPRACNTRNTNRMALSEDAVNFLW